MTNTHPRAAERAFVVVCIAVLLSVSTWFSATAATPVLAELWHLGASGAAALTTATQVGFILGTLAYAMLNLSDVFDARKVFFASALLGALFNALFATLAQGLVSALVLRLLVGFTLAGVYPVGMKLLAGWFTHGLGYRLGIMVAALTLGTALPYLLRATEATYDWRLPVLLSSALAVVGGALVLVLVGKGPHERRGTFDARMMLKVFREPRFRLSALGYFGHMWELYAFWALVAAWIAAVATNRGWEGTPVPLIAFAVIGLGGLGCAAGGYWSAVVGERRVALVALATSGVLALLSPLAFDLPAPLLLVYLGVWSIAVVADSPQFSALSARYAPRDYVGTALTIQNGVGFAITIATLQLVPVLAELAGWRWAFAVLALGPALGVVATWRLPREQP